MNYKYEKTFTPDEVYTGEYDDISVEEAKQIIEQKGMVIIGFCPPHESGHHEWFGVNGTVYPPFGTGKTGNANPRFIVQDAVTYYYGKPFSELKAPEGYEFVSDKLGECTSYDEWWLSWNGNVCPGYPGARSILKLRKVAPKKRKFVVEFEEEHLFDPCAHTFAINTNRGHLYYSYPLTLDIPVKPVSIKETTDAK